MEYACGRGYNSAAMPGAHATSTPEPSSRPAILYVEDNVINAKVMKLGMRKDYDVVVAATAKEACAAIQSQVDAFTVILMDIELQNSDLDGIELTRLFRGRLDAHDLPPHIRAPLVECPIIIVTAYQERFSEDFLSQAGADASLRKPVNMQELRELVKTLVARRPPQDPSPRQTS